ASFLAAQLERRTALQAFPQAEARGVADAGVRLFLAAREHARLARVEVRRAPAALRVAGGAGAAADEQHVGDAVLVGGHALVVAGAVAVARGEALQERQ